MASTRNSRAVKQGKQVGVGLLANGSSGAWEIAIDETTSGAERLFAQIDGPAVSLYFEIPSLEMVDTVLQFIESNPNGTNAPPTRRGRHDATLLIGNDKGLSVALVRDDEYDDRFFLIVGAAEAPTLRLVIAGPDMAHIVAALRQVKDDLEA